MICLCRREVGDEHFCLRLLEMCIDFCFCVDISEAAVLLHDHVVNQLLHFQWNSIFCLGYDSAGKRWYSVHCDSSAALSMNVAVKQVRV